MEEINAIAPLISICVPVYNADAYLTQTLSCLCNQDYQNLEIIMVNDGSTDRSATLIKSHTDPRIIFTDVPNGGAAKARNIALDHSSGDYILFFDADDFIPPSYISSQYQLLKDNEEDVVIALWGRFYGNDLNSFRPEPLPSAPISFKEWICLYWLKAAPMTNPGRVLIPRKLIDKVGGWDETLSLYDDFEFFTRVFLQAKRIIPNEKAIFYYRSGIGGLSSHDNSKAHLSYYNAIDISVDNVLKAYVADQILQKSCANMWQLFVYTVFPQDLTLVKKAEQHISRLGGADLVFPAGKLTLILTNLIGWKLTKKIKRLF